MATVDSTGKSYGTYGTYGTDQGGGTDKTSGPGKGQSVGSGVIGGNTGNVPVGQGGGGSGGSQVPSFNTRSGDTGATSNRLESNPPLTNEQLKQAIATLMSSVRDPDKLATLIMEFASMSRQNALDVRLAARAQARSELEGQASETREAAQKALIAAAVSFAFAVVSAVISIGSAVSSIGKIKEGLASTKDAIQTQKIADGITGNGLGDLANKSKLNHIAEGMQKSGDAAIKLGDARSQLGQAISGLMNAVGKLSEGILQGMSKYDEARGQELAAAAQDSQANADFAKQFMDELQEMLNAAMQFLKEMAQAETDMMATASRL